MHAGKISKKPLFYLEKYGYIYRAIFVVIFLYFTSNIYSLGFSKAGFVFADEESGTDTLQSIISTSTITDLTSNDSIATTSIIGDSVGDIFSEIVLPASNESTGTSSTTEDSLSSQNDSTSTDVSDSNASTSSDSSDLISTSTEESTSTISTSTATSSVSDESNSTSSNNSTSTENNNPVESNATSSDESKKVVSTSTNKTDIENQPAVSAVISPILGGTFKSGRIPVIVSFNERVYVTGKPQLILSTGNSEVTNIDYLSGSGSRFLIFLYYIKSGDSASSLDYQNSSSLILNGGSIKDSSGNNADTTLPDPGSSASLSGSTDITIKTAPKI